MTMISTNTNTNAIIPLLMAIQDTSMFIGQLLTDKENWKGESRYDKLTEICKSLGEWDIKTGHHIDAQDYDAMMDDAENVKILFNDYVRVRNRIIDDIIEDGRSWNPPAFFKNKFNNMVLYHQYLLEYAMDTYAEAVSE